MNREQVLRFLASIGRPSESEFYVRLFSEREGGRFAVLAIAGSVATELTDAVVADLSFLATLGLKPVLVVGLDDPGRAWSNAAKLAGRLDDAEACTPGDITKVESDRVAIVAVDTPDEDQRFAYLGRLVSDLGCEKMVFVGRRSGLAREDGTVPTLVNLHRDFDGLSQSGVLVAGHRRLLRRIRQLLDSTGHHLTVAVTSPFDLIRELFTVRGAGTLIRRGAEIACATAYDQLDQARLLDLLTRAFEKEPRPDLLTQEVDAIYIAGDYRGAAMVSRAPMASYLSKFAVDVSARGEGLGSDLWHAVTDDHTTLLWRSRPDNPIAWWYAKVCHGMQRSAEWSVFWRGIDAAVIPAAIDFALQAPVDFAPT